LPAAFIYWLPRGFALALAAAVFFHAAWRGIDGEPSWLTRWWRRQRERTRVDGVRVQLIGRPDPLPLAWTRRRRRSA
jgi:hypothetical protein